MCSVHVFISKMSSCRLGSQEREQGRGKEKYQGKRMLAGHEVQGDRRTWGGGKGTMVR